MAAVCNVHDAALSTQLLASTTLRNVLGTKSLSDILSDREQTAQVILGQLDEATDPWGIKVRNQVMDYGAYADSFRLSVLRSRMCDFRNNCKELWLLKRRLLERPELRSLPPRER